MITWIITILIDSLNYTGKIFVLYKKRLQRRIIDIEKNEKVLASIRLTSMAFIAASIKKKRPTPYLFVYFAVFCQAYAACFVMAKYSSKCLDQKVQLNLKTAQAK